MRDPVTGYPVTVKKATVLRIGLSIPEGKPPAVAEKIVEGKLNKWFEDHVVLEQSFVKDDSMTVGELVNSVSGLLGEKMSVRRFAKFALGE